MSGKNRKTGNLVALGSAAVVAVYGAGFMRTAEAAQRFAAQSDERRVESDDIAPGVTVGGVAATPASPAPTPATVPGIVDSSPHNAQIASAVARVAQNETAAKPTADVPPPVRKVDATLAKAAEPSASGSRAGTVVVPMPPEITTVTNASGAAVTPPQPTAVESRTAAAEKPASVAVTPTPPPTKSPIAAPASPKATPAVETAPAAAVNAPTATASITNAQTATAQTATAPTANAQTANANAASAKFKDGEYTGYGTSRHGDVEVYVETTDGKITYVKISQCLTQYSCSWIEDLPRQVLARQSTRVDAVSGATQSANAFYYALVAALAKAK